MADDTNVSVIPLHHAPLKKRARKAAGRVGANRPRKKRAKVETSDEAEFASSASLLPSEFLIPPEFLPANDVSAEPPVTPQNATPQASDGVTRSRRQLAPALLSIAALALAVVGFTINGWYACLLGSCVFVGWF